MDVYNLEKYNLDRDNGCRDAKTGALERVWGIGLFLFCQ